MLAAFPDTVERLYPLVAARLVDRFREREEQVKTDVFAAYTQLLHAIAAASKRCGFLNGKTYKITIMMNMRLLVYRYSGDSMVGPAGLLLEDAPSVLSAATRQLRGKSHKTRIGALSVLLQLVQAVPSSLEGRVGALVPGVQAALQVQMAMETSPHCMNVSHGDTLRL